MLLGVDQALHELVLGLLLQLMLPVPLFLDDSLPLALLHLLFQASLEVDFLLLGGEPLSPLLLLLGQFGQEDGLDLLFLLDATGFQLEVHLLFVELHLLHLQVEKVLVHHRLRAGRPFSLFLALGSGRLLLHNHRPLFRDFFEGQLSTAGQGRQDRLPFLH